MKKRIYQAILFILYIGMIAFFSYQCLKNGNDSSNISTNVGNVVADVIETTTPVEIDRSPDYFALIRKLIGHYGYFVILGLVSFLLYHSFDRIRLEFRLGLHFGTGLAFSLFSEFVLQAIAEERGPSFKDAMLDYGGFVSLSLILMVIVILKLILNKEKKQA